MKYYHPSLNAINESQSNWSIPLGFSEEEQAQTENTAFVNGVQHYWDSTSIGLFKTCGRKYNWAIVQGYVPRTMPPPLAFGIHLHTLLQTWHNLVESGIDKNTAFMRVTRLAGLLGETLPEGDSARTKETLVRSIVWYLDVYYNDAAKTVRRADGKAAVEQHFMLPFLEHKGQTVYICGHLDRLVTWQGQTFCCDYKTTKYSLDGRFFEQYKPSIQMSLYVVASHLISQQNTDIPTAHGIIVDGIQLGTNYTRFARQIIPYSLEEVDEFIVNLQHWIIQAMDTSQAGIFLPNETACGNYSGCHFREICSKPPARRQVFLDGNFTKRIWDPTRER